MTISIKIIKMPYIIGTSTLCIGLIETIFLFFMFYANESSVDLIPLLRINFYIVFFIFMLVIFIVLWTTLVNYFNITKQAGFDDDFRNNKKW